MIFRAGAGTEVGALVSSSFLSGIALETRAGWAARDNPMYSGHRANAAQKVPETRTGNGRSFICTLESDLAGTQESVLERFLQSRGCKMLGVRIAGDQHDQGEGITSQRYRYLAWSPNWATHRVSVSSIVKQKTQPNDL